MVDLRTGMLTLEWFMWFQNPEVQEIIIGSAIGVPSGGTGLTSGTSGGILGFTASTTMASSVELTANEIVLGGGAGATPIPLGDLGTTNQVLHGNASGSPTWSAVDLSADVTGVLEIESGGTNSAVPLDGASVVVSNGVSIIQGPKGSANTVLHGNISGTPSYSAVVEGDMFLVDVTTLNSTAARHGFLPKLSNDPDTFLDGEGNWTAVINSITCAALEPIGYWSPVTDADTGDIIYTDNQVVCGFICTS